MRINLGSPKDSSKRMITVRINNKNNPSKDPGSHPNENEESKHPGKNSSFSGKNKSKGANRKNNKGTATPEEEKRSKNPDKGGGFRSQHSGKSNKSKKSVDLSAGKPKGGAPHPKHPASASKPKAKTFQKDT
jgi:hypothetical protein